MITLLNTSILTTYGKFEYTQVSLEHAKYLVQNHDFQSAIGHEATAQIMSTLLNTDVPVNRIFYEQQKGDIALIFKLKGRPEEGTILSKEEIEKIGYEWGILEKLE